MSKRKVEIFKEDGVERVYTSPTEGHGYRLIKKYFPGIRLYRRFETLEYSQRRLVSYHGKDGKLHALQVSV